jgi:hypothetical protein
VDFNFWLAIYLVGAAITFLLILVKLFLSLCLRWMTKVSIWQKNLAKIQPPKENLKWYWNVAMFLGMSLIECCLSWINVPVLIWQIIKILLDVIREMFTSVPERIKELRYPIRNIPNLEAESVWAHGLGLSVCAGSALPTVTSIVSELNEIKSFNRNFNPAVAVDHLKRLGVVSAEITTRVAERLNARHVADEDLADYKEDEGVAT